eukprot:GHVS01053273.1.p1 GENE.GHVS01053273.1~~GHVS01053273.1.p1  ORF type:complete len:219 (+),score=32.31 GHVS01053273.1:62-718(+)
MISPPNSPSAVLPSPFHLPPASPPTLQHRQSRRPPRVPPLTSVTHRSRSPSSKRLHSSVPPLSSQRTSQSSLIDSAASPFTMCCHYLSHLLCGSGSLCQPVRCVIDQNEVEVIPGTARTNMTTSRSSRPESTARSSSSIRHSLHGGSMHSPTSPAFRTPLILPSSPQLTKAITSSKVPSPHLSTKSTTSSHETVTAISSNAGGIIDSVRTKPKSTWIS